MVERRVPDPSKGPYDTVAYLENQDTNIQALRALRIHLQRQFADHLSAIQRGDLGEGSHYDLPEFIPFNPTTYPVEMTPRGALMSRYPDHFPHLPSHHDPSGELVELTLGDLEAAAEWGMQAALQPDTRHSIHSVRLRQQVENVRYQAIMRRMFLARLLLADQVWKQVTKLVNEQNIPWSQVVEHYRAQSVPAKPLTRPMMEKALLQPGMLAERFTFTLAARLGARSVPPFRVFRARAGVDANEHVDLLLRVEPVRGTPTLAGIDVTTKQRPELVWAKQSLQESSGHHAISHTLRDPATLNKHLPARRSVLSTPDIPNWGYLHNLWLRRRGDTAITPECFMRSDHRGELGKRLLAHVREPNGVSYYSKTSIDSIYAAVYGQYDAAHP